MTADALKRQVEPVSDLASEPSRSVQRLFAINLVAGEDHHTANGVADGPERFVLYLGKLADDAVHRARHSSSDHSVDARVDVRWVGVLPRSKQLWIER